MTYVIWSCLNILRQSLVYIIWYYHHWLTVTLSGLSEYLRLFNWRGKGLNLGVLHAKCVLNIWAIEKRSIAEYHPLEAIELGILNTRMHNSRGVLLPSSCPALEIGGHWIRYTQPTERLICLIKPKKIELLEFPLKFIYQFSLGSTL